MTSRRSFLAALGALVPAWMCGRKVEAAELPKPVTATILGPHGASGATYRAMIKPHPREGISHFSAEAVCRSKGHHKCYLDGVEVTTRTSEADTLEGWVKIYDASVDSEGRTRITEPIVQRIHYGNVCVTVDGVERGQLTKAVQVDFSAVRRRLSDGASPLLAEDIEVYAVSSDGVTQTVHLRIRSNWIRHHGR